MQEWVYKSFRHVVVVLIDDWGLGSASAQFRGRHIVPTERIGDWRLSDPSVRAFGNEIARMIVRSANLQNS